jgi:hypothetical protein
MPSSQQQQKDTRHKEDGQPESAIRQERIKNKSAFRLKVLRW